MCFGFDFGAGVFHRDGKSTSAHHWKIDDVVSNEGGFGGGDFLFFENLAEDSCFVLNTLVNMVNFQVAGAQGNGFGESLGNESGL